MELLILGLVIIGAVATVDLGEKKKSKPTKTEEV